MKYSKILVSRLQKHFKEKYNEDVDEETGQEYLESMVSLFNLFKK